VVRGRILILVVVKATAMLLDLRTSHELVELSMGPDEMQRMAMEALLLLVSMNRRMGSRASE
jgi:hypothetical protein